jgi:homoserine kinase type II
VAVPLATSAGTSVVEHDGRLWTAGPFLDGQPEAEPSASRFRIRGRLLGRLHRDLEEFDLPGQRPQFGKTWELDTWLVPSNVGTFNSVLAQFARDYGDLAASVRRSRHRNLRELSRLHYPDLPDLAIHGDFQNNNLLWSGGQLTGLLDFDFARRDALACDLSTILIPFQPLPLKHAGAFLNGYQAARPLSDREWALLPALARASLLWWVALLMAWWRTGANPNAARGIARTMALRMPALDRWEEAFRSLPRPSGS